MLYFNVFKFGLFQFCFICFYIIIQSAKIVIDLEIFIHGRYDWYNEHNNFFKFDTEELKWYYIVQSGTDPGQRSGHSLSRIDRNLYLFAGDISGMVYNEIFIFNLDNHFWTKPDVNGELPDVCFSLNL